MTATQITWNMPEGTEVRIAYSGSTVVLGLIEAQGLLSIIMTPGQATHLLMELRESLNDLNTEDTGEPDE